MSLNAPLHYAYIEVKHLFEYVLHRLCDSNSLSLINIEVSLICRFPLQCSIANTIPKVWTLEFGKRHNN
jgi:hypothetical protein